MKRRVSDLISEGIPEDEAQLLKNGRFVCTVCKHRPIFDTPVILGIHRRGKKHQARCRNYCSTTTKEGIPKLDEQLDMAMRCCHGLEYYQQRLHTQTEAADSQGSGLKYLGDGCIKRSLATKKYDPRVKKVKRKTVLDIRSSEYSAHGEPQSIEEYVKRKKAGEEREQFVVKPYQSQHISDRGCLQRGSISKDASFSTKNSVITQRPSTSAKSKNNDQPAISKKSDDQPRNQHSCMTAEEAEKQRKHVLYLQARGSGWKQDISGNWSKEDGVEFDSDEEPPVIT